MNNKKDCEIIIKIDDAVQTKSFNEENIIHKDAYERIKNLISQNLKKAKEYNKILNENKNFERVHNTITINGERGAGKTSFMLSIKTQYENNNEIEVLDIFDPTLISTKQHVFILLLAMIEKKVDEKFNSKCREKKFDDEYKKWKESLEKLAKGLNQLDGIGSNPYHNDIWDDSALIMARGLDMARAGLNLEQKFHLFVNKSLELLDKKAFLLFIDDIDTDFSKGWDILEILRKYITTPQIIPIMAGNFELYENLVRKEKSKLFKELIEFDDKIQLNNNLDNKKINYLNQVNELTQQYLIKVLQPVNMITLYKLYYYLTYKNKEIYIEEIEETEKDGKKIIKKGLDDFIRESIFRIFYKIYYPEYSDIITNLPLRTIFQYLYFAKICKCEESFLDANANIFIDNFFNLGIKNEFFEIIKTKYGFNKFTASFITIFSFDDIKEYRPNYNKLDLNIALMIIPQFLNFNRRLFDKLKYGIEVSLQFYLYEKLNKKNLNEKKDIFNKLKINKKLDSVDRIKNILEIIIIESIDKIKFSYQIYKKQDINNINFDKFKNYLYKYKPEFLGGLLEDVPKIDKNSLLNEIKGYEQLIEGNKDKKTLNDFQNYLENEKKTTIYDLKKIIKDLTFNDIRNINDILLSLVFFEVKINQEIHYYISPLKLISLLIDILEILESSQCNNKKEKVINQIINDYTNKDNWFINTNVEANENINDIEDEEDENEKNIEEIENKEFINSILKWYSNNKIAIKNFRNKLHIINWSYFYYNFYKKIEKSNNRNCITISDSIKLFLYIFINELIKILFKDEKETIKEVSSIKSIKYFKSNLIKIAQRNQEYEEFIKIFTECPIFKEYLESENTLLDKILLVQG